MHVYASYTLLSLECIPQGPVLLLAMCSVMVYAFLQPYHRLTVNLLEIFTMVDVLLLLMISSTEQFKVLEPYAPQHILRYHFVSESQNT